MVGYIGSLAVMLIAAFWSVDALSGELDSSFSFDNFQTLIDDTVYRTSPSERSWIAALVTVTDALLAFPIAFYMAKVASPRRKGILIVAVLMPLWSFYLVKVYAWRAMLSDGGVINWALDPFGISRARATAPSAVWLVDDLPLAAVHDPSDLRRAGADPGLADRRLGGPRRGAVTTFRRVILPLAFPAVVAGSIFTFSLTLGDYITPSLVSPTRSSSATSSTPTSPTTCRSPPPSRSSRSW